MSKQIIKRKENMINQNQTNRTKREPRKWFLKFLFLGICAWSLLSPKSAQAVAWLGIDRNVNQGNVDKRMYGVNFQRALDPSVASNGSFKARVSEMNPSIVRYHAAEMIINGNSKSWVNYGSRTWNTSKIRSVLSNRPRNAEIMITIAGWPDWMKAGNGKLLEWKKDEYANFCAKLVEIVNSQLRYNVKYWEPFNEMDFVYSGSGDMWHLADIHKRCAQKMKQKDGSIKIVAGAWSQPYDPDINDFLYNLSSSDFDVFSYHAYASGPNTNKNDIYNRAESYMTSGLSTLRGRLNARGFGNKPIWVGEYNIFWTWNVAGNYQMTNSVGTVFDALAMRSVVKQGLAGALIPWNAADGTYGKIQSNFGSFHSGGHLLRRLRAHAVGRLVRSTSSESSVKTFAVTSGSKTTLVIINRGNSAQTLFLNRSTFNPNIIYKMEPSKTFTGSHSLEWANIPADSVWVAVDP